MTDKTETRRVQPIHPPNPRLSRPLFLSVTYVAEFLQYTVVRGRSSHAHRRRLANQDTVVQLAALPQISKVLPHRPKYDPPGRQLLYSHLRSDLTLSFCWIIPSYLVSLHISCVFSFLMLFLCIVLIFFSCVLHLLHAVICTSCINPAVPIPKGVIFCMQNYKCLEWFAIVDGFQ